ncbi:MAG: hypothetical protein LBH97_00605 [Treponema sp.]|jgi:hypothetical protein|nr:hypothetical protein [Treponema sp.]
MNIQKGIARVLFFSCVLIWTAGIGYAQVNQGELEQNLAPVTFINFEGPHSKIETREQIRQIGVGLGQTIKAGSLRAGASNRYFVIHSVSEPDGRKLDADIFGLGSDTAVDHIRNLRTIIQGYLQTAYDYSASDAALLAEYITIYNAVYRRDWNYFSDRYKAPVLQNLSPERVGLSIRFNEWPGQSLIVIPLGIGGLSSVDTSTISDSRVVEELRKDDDLGVEQRQDMVDLKEREAAVAEQQASTEREAIRNEERQIAQEREQIAEERVTIERERQQAQNDPERQAALDQREAEASQRAEELDRREEQLAERREEAQRQEDFAEQKTTEAQRERESIAQDQQAVIDSNRPQGVIGVSLASADAVLGRLVRLDPANGQELRRSPLDTVYVRTLTFFNGKILAIAGENRGNGAVRLIEINSNTLEMVKQGDNDIHPGSLIWTNGSDLYVIVADLTNGNLNLGRFNTDLVLQAKSGITVHPNASVNVQDGNLLTQRGDGTAAILNPANLTEKK